MMTKEQIVKYGEVLYSRLRTILGHARGKTYYLMTETVCINNTLGYTEKHLGFSVSESDTKYVMARFILSYARECDLHLVDAIRMMTCPEAVVIFPDMRLWVRATCDSDDNLKWDSGSVFDTFSSNVIDSFCTDFHAPGFDFEEPVVNMDHDAGGMIFVDRLLNNIYNYQQSHPEFSWRVGVTGFMLDDAEAAIDSAKVIQMRGVGEASLVICRDSSIHMSKFPITGLFFAVMTSWTRELGDLVFLVPEWRYCVRLNRDGPGSDKVSVCNCDDPITFEKFDGLSLDLSAVSSLFPSNASAIRAECCVDG